MWPYSEIGSLQTSTVKIRSLAGLGWALNPMTGVLIRKGEDTETHKEKGHVKIGAEIRAMQLRAKERQEHPFSFSDVL